MIYNTANWIHIEDDDFGENFTSWYIDKKNKKVISVANLSKEQEETWESVLR